jgi:hypothetical protein
MKYDRIGEKMTKNFKDLFIQYNPLKKDEPVMCKCGGNCKCKPKPDQATARVLEIIDKEINDWGYGTKEAKALIKFRAEILKGE